MADLFKEIQVKNSDVFEFKDFLSKKLFEYKRKAIDKLKIVSLIGENCLTIIFIQ